MGTACDGGRRQGPTGREAARAADANTRPEEAIRCVVDRTPAAGRCRARRVIANKGGTAAEPAVLALPGPDRAGRAGVASSCSACDDCAASFGCCSATDADKRAGRDASHVATRPSSPATRSCVPVSRERRGAAAAPATCSHLSEACSYICPYCADFRTCTATGGMGYRPWPAVLAAGTVKGSSPGARRPGAPEAGSSHPARVPSAGRTGAAADEAGARASATPCRSIPSIPTSTARYVFSGGGGPARTTTRAYSDCRTAFAIIRIPGPRAVHARPAR
jgi:hypothetical protein